MTPGRYPARGVPVDVLALSQELLVVARSGEGDLAALVGLLAGVEPTALADDAARLAFWVNVYNARVKSAVREREMTGNLRRYRGFFRSVGWVVGGRPITLHEMEHGLLRTNRPAPRTFWRPLSAADPRLAWAPEHFDNRVHFALNCGATSCPPIRAYAADKLDMQLGLATRAYLDGEVQIDGDTLMLPWLCKLFSRDFPDLRTFVAAHVDAERAAWIVDHPEARIRWGVYRWEIGE